jgi:branched-chain amino acid transport system permease protein
MLKQDIKRHTKLIAIIIALVLVAFIPMFIRSPYIMDRVIIVIVYAILAMTFIIGLRTGLINMGIVAFWGIGAYVSAMLVMKLHLSFWLSLPVSTLITGAIAFGFSYILIRGVTAGFTFVLLTSVIGMSFSLAMGNIQIVGGFGGLPNIPPPNPIHIPLLQPILFDSKVQFFYLALVLLVITILIIKAFNSAWTGRAWTAIGLNPKIAKSIGINIFRYKMLSFVLASAIAGMAGSFYAHYIGFLSPSAFGISQNINLQTYAILGGIDYAILGPLLGTVIMIFIPEILRFAPEVAPIITGTILVLLILFLPKGLLSFLKWRPMIYKKKQRQNGCYSGEDN